jgi:hypothetical protein
MVPTPDTSVSSTKSSDDSPRSRRELLSLGGTALGGTAFAALTASAGCLSRGGGTPTDEGSPSDTSAEPSDTETTTDTATNDTKTDDSVSTETTESTPVTVTLRWVSSVPTDATATVYPRKLREWLRTAAKTGDTLRVSDETFVYDPAPLLLTFDAVELITDEEAVAGSYEVTGTGDTRYEILVGASEVDDPPADATVTPLSELSQKRRDLVARVVAGERVTISPETKLGEWVRTTFFGGYVRTDDGTVYRGTERQQTDAEFFSREVWYVFSLSPADVTAQHRLRLREIPIDVRATIDERIAPWPSNREYTFETTTDSPLGTFARETDYLLTHAGQLSVEVETA